MPVNRNIGTLPAYGLGGEQSASLVIRMVLVVMGLGWTMTTQSQIEEGKSKPLVGMESHIRAGY